MREPSVPGPGRHRAGGQRARPAGRHRTPRRSRSSSTVAVTAVTAVTAGALASGMTLAVEWPVSGAKADSAGIAGTSPTRTTVGSVTKDQASPRPSGRAADDPAREPRQATGRPDKGGTRDADRATTSRSGDRNRGAPQGPEWLAGCAGDQDLESHENGTLPDDELCALPTDGHHLRPSAARAWWRLDEAYQQEFGTPMCVTDSYRSLEQQEALAMAKPGLAAQPGTSNHGWASALDLCGGAESFGTVQYEWLSAQAPEWGWENPQWAQAGGSKPEAWHWEYVEKG